MTILAYSNIPRPVVSTAENILGDLTLHTSLSSLTSLKVFWDLDSNVVRILSVLPEPVRSAISQHNRAVYGSYRLYYIPSKIFSITHDHRDTDFFDLSQYFPDDPEPSTLLGVQRKADELWQLLVDLGMHLTTTLASPVAVAMSSRVLDRKVKDTVPTIWDVQDNQLDAFEYALQAGAREWVSNYQVGEWI